MQDQAKGNELKTTRSISAAFLTALNESLQSISEPVLYGDERGFQGALLHELNARLGHGVLPDDPVIQQKFQKRLRHHGIKIRRTSSCTSRLSEAEWKIVTKATLWQSS